MHGFLDFDFYHPRSGVVRWCLSFPFFAAFFPLFLLFFLFFILPFLGFFLSFWDFFPLLFVFFLGSASLLDLETSRFSSSSSEVTSMFSISLSSDASSTLFP